MMSTWLKVRQKCKSPKLCSKWMISQERIHSFIQSARLPLDMCVMDKNHSGCLHDLQDESEIKMENPYKFMLVDN